MTLRETDVGGTATSPSGADIAALMAVLTRLAAIIENFEARKDAAYTLTADMQDQLRAFSTVLRSLSLAAPRLPNDAVLTLRGALNGLEVALRAVEETGSGSFGALLLAYQGALVPYVLLANVESEIRRAIEEARDRVEVSLRKMSDDADASIVQSVRAASEERRRLETEVERLRKNLVDDLRSTGESIIAGTKADMSEQVLGNAQKEFALARERAERDVVLWAVVTATFIGAFSVFGWYLLQSQQALFIAHPRWTWQFVYIGGLRLSLLAAVAALGSFSLRMLKRHIEVRQAVAYKCRLLKSIPGLLVASHVDNRYSTLRLVLSALLSEKEFLAPDDNPEMLNASLPTLSATKKSRDTGAG
jgi:hypothetical protein